MSGEDFYNGDCFPKQTKMTSYNAKMIWTVDTAVAFCRKVETFAPRFGYHIGLTGGSLYKEGARKDLDMIVYPHNSPDNVIDDKGFEDELLKMGVFIESNHYGWLKKAKYDFKNIDIFYLMRDYKGCERGKTTEYPVADNIHTIEVDFSDPLGDSTLAIP